MRKFCISVFVVGLFIFFYYLFNLIISSDLLNGYKILLIAIIIFIVLAFVQFLWKELVIIGQGILIMIKELIDRTRKNNSYERINLASRKLFNGEKKRIR